MSVQSLAVIGKNNEPIYIKEFLDDDDGIRQYENFPEEELFGLKLTSHRHVECSIRQQFILHAALDRFDQLSGPPPGCAWRDPGVAGADAMFVGLLCPVDDMRVFGYMTTTQMRFLLTVEDDAAAGDQKTVDETIKRLFVKLHRIYVEYILNPFSPLTGPIRSDLFDQKIADCVRAYNRAN